METLYIIVAGSRGWRDYARLARKLDHLTQNYDKVVVVSGCARGADTMGEQWARERGHAIKQFPANWNVHGYEAGKYRNVEMADFVSMQEHCACACFWDGVSRGTRHMIGTAKLKSIPLRVISNRIIRS